MLVNVTIFALPMSSTQIVFSGLTGIALIFLKGGQGEVVDAKWLSLELMFWLLTPVAAVLISLGFAKIIELKIFSSRGARMKIIKFIPFQVSGTFSFMLFCCLMKDVGYIANEG